MLPKYKAIVDTTSSSDDDLVVPKMCLVKADSKDSMGVLSNHSNHTTSTVGSTSHASACSSCSKQEQTKESAKQATTAAPPVNNCLSLFFSQLLGDITNQAETKTASTKTCDVSLIQDNARVHGDKLGLVQSRSMKNFAAQQDGLSPAAFHFRDMIVSIIDDSTQQRHPLHPRIDSLNDMGARVDAEEQRQEAVTSIRVPQRPCRWSPNNSFNKGAPASPPSKVDHSPTLPARRLSSDGMALAPLMVDQLLFSPSDDINPHNQTDIHDVLAMLEREEPSED